MRLLAGLTAGFFVVSTAAFAAPAMPADSSAGQIMVDQNGMTLYTFDNDTQGVSNCNDSCADAWPPLLASDADMPDGDWTIIMRTDGSKMWAYMGMPVYLYVGDAMPGDVSGDNVGNVWHVIPAAGTSSNANG